MPIKIIISMPIIVTMTLFVTKLIMPIIALITFPARQEDRGHRHQNSRYPRHDRRDYPHDLDRDHRREETESARRTGDKCVAADI